MSDWTPPEKLWAIFAHTNTDDYFILAVDRESKIRAGQYARQEVVSYVPESAVDALREEVERLRAKGLDDFTVTGDEYDRVLGEVERLTRERDEARHNASILADRACKHIDAAARLHRKAFDRARAALAGSPDPAPVESREATCPDLPKIPACPPDCEACEAERGSGREATCPNCGGKGGKPLRVPRGTLTHDNCLTCGGSGRVPTKEET